jgi:hypothetical protein
VFDIEGVIKCSLNLLDYSVKPEQGSSVSMVSRPALGPTQPLIRWVTWFLSLGGKARPRRDSDHSPPSSAEVKNEKELYFV